MIQRAAQTVVDAVCIVMDDKSTCVYAIQILILAVVLFCGTIVISVPSIVFGVLITWTFSELFSDWVESLQPHLRVDFAKKWSFDQLLYVALCSLGMVLGVIQAAVGGSVSALIFILSFPCLVLAPIASVQLGVVLRLAYVSIFVIVFWSQYVSHFAGFVAYVGFLVATAEIQGYRWSCRPRDDPKEI